MQEETIIHQEYPSQNVPLLSKATEPKVIREYDEEFEAKITPLFLQRKYMAVVSMTEDTNSCCDPSNKEVNVGQELGEHQDFMNPNVPDMDNVSTNEVSAISSPGSFYLSEEAASQNQSAVSHMMVEENVCEVEHSIPKMLKRYYLQNEIDLVAWNTNPVLKRLLPILLQDQKITSGILLIPEKRPDQLLKKIHLTALRILRLDQELMQDLAEHAEFFEAQTFKAEHRKLIASNSKLFERICNLSFFKLLHKNLHEETVSDIRTNLLSRFDVTDPTKLEQAFGSMMEEEGKRKRTFKKPFTVMENFWSLILYCNEILFELQGAAVSEKRNTIQEIKNHFVSQLKAAGLTIDETVYPVKRSAKATKDLYFQAFLHVV